MTDLYQRIVDYDYGDAERSKLVRDVWAPTPWVVDVYDGPHETGLRWDVTQWCRARYGPECSTIHETAGTWQRGGVTIHGWTWYGFATEEQMDEFMAAWPAPESATP